MKDLMNINSDRLISFEIDDNIKVGDLIHSKGERITDFGRTWKVEKVTPSQVKVIAEAVIVSISALIS